MPMTSALAENHVPIVYVKTGKAQITTTTTTTTTSTVGTINNPYNFGLRKNEKKNQEIKK